MYLIDKKRSDRFNERQYRSQLGGTWVPHRPVTIFGRDLALEQTDEAAAAKVVDDEAPAGQGNAVTRGRSLHRERAVVDVERVARARRVGRGRIKPQSPAAFRVVDQDMVRKLRLVGRPYAAVIGRAHHRKQRLVAEEARLDPAPSSRPEANGKV